MWFSTWKEAECDPKGTWSSYVYATVITFIDFFDKVHVKGKGKMSATDEIWTQHIKRTLLRAENRTKLLTQIPVIKYLDNITKLTNLHFKPKVSVEL
jgi:hypothetical protein